MKRLGNRAITLIELVVVIAVAATAIPVLMTVWSTVTWQSVRTEGTAEATFYAEGLMEEIKSKRFDENSTVPWSAALGIDAAENTNDARSFDDVDDFVNATDANITLSGTVYNRSVSVEYATLNSTNDWVSCGAVASCNSLGACPNCCISCNECCYKLISVNVRRTDNLPTNVTLKTIVAGY